MTSLVESYDDYTRAVDNKLNIDSIYLDIHKAFDSVNHDILKLKLINIGLGKNIVAWLSNFLLNRKFDININGFINIQI